MTQINLVDWFDEHRITEVECLVPDITGIPRGKIMPAQKFLQGTAPRLPEAIFIQSVTGEYPEDPQDTLTDPAIIDIRLVPDAKPCGWCPGRMSRPRRLFMTANMRTARRCRWRRARCCSVC